LITISLPVLAYCLFMYHTRLFRCFCVCIQRVLLNSALKYNDEVTANFDAVR